MPETGLPPRTSLKRSSPTLLVAAIALAVAVGGGVWLWLGGTLPGLGSDEAAPAPAVAPAAATPDAPEDAPAPTAAPADVRALLEAASPDATFRGWLGEGDLIERWAAVTENLAGGESPRPHLAFLRPAAEFSVVRRGGKTVIAPASYRRYDGFADAIATLDAPALARAYRALHPALDGAFRALGYPRGALDGATRRALQRIVEAPVVDADVAVVEDEGVYVFADAALEHRPEVDKHLLRMGPRNTRLLQAKARELLAALEPAGAVTPAVAR